MRELTTAEAQALAARTDFQWWQRFELAPGVVSPGVNVIETLLERSSLPEDLSGKSVLDIGTTNAGAAFIAERRGADRVVAVDIFDASLFGVDILSKAFESKVEFVQSSIYELPTHPVIAGEQFDHVLFLGVLYHLRHPLLALDCLRQLTREAAYLETAVSDYGLPGQLPPVAQFHRTGELNNDPSNWFTPNLACLNDWVSSAGFSVEVAALEPAEGPHRAQLNLRPTPGDPEWIGISYERRISVSVDWSTPDVHRG
jgi:tRNA (mo5U34)-methyltransferase